MSRRLQFRVASSAIASAAGGINATLLGEMSTNPSLK
jgi:hypothetical protein